MAYLEVAEIQSQMCSSPAVSLSEVILLLAKLCSFFSGLKVGWVVRVMAVATGRLEQKAQPDSSFSFPLADTELKD